MCRCGGHAAAIARDRSHECFDEPGLRGPIFLCCQLTRRNGALSTTLPAMFSPFRARDAPPASLGLLPDTELPLHLALAWLIVKATPVNDHGHPINVYSPTFVAAVLEIVAREVLEVSYSRCFCNLTPGESRSYFVRGSEGRDGQAHREGGRGCRATERQENVARPDRERRG